MIAQSPAKLFEVPYQRNPYFTGRRDFLESLRARLTAARAGTRRAVICGMGGVGKSQVALEYVYRHQDDYRMVWWLSAEDVTSLGFGYARLAQRIGMRNAADASLDQIRHHVRRALDESDDWLLVFDNVVRPEDVRDFLPLRGAGHVLITSQVSEWGNLASTLPLRELARDESVQFLVRRTDRGDADGLASKVAKTLGDLPLALEQAGAVIAQTGSSYAEYLRRFETHWVELLQRGRLSADHPDSLAMTLELTLRQVSDESPASVALLHLCAFLAPEHIGKNIFLDAAMTLPAPIGGAAANQLEETLGPLQRYSLIENTARSISMHRLVASLARHRLTQEEKLQWSAAAAQLLAAQLEFDGLNPATWSKCGELLTHALVAAAHADRLAAAPRAVEMIYSSAGRYLLKQARLRDAQTVLERAVVLARDLYGVRHPRLSDASNNLARVLQKLGDVSTAAAHFETALSIDRDIYGSADPRVAAVSNNYGMCLLATGKFDEAKHHFEWALSVYRKTYGDQSAKVASVLNNLGCALRDGGMDADGARQHFEDALRVAEIACGANHPTTSSILYNTAVLSRNAGDFEAAERAIRRALLIDEAAFGPGHPDVARDLVELSRVLGDAGQLAQAKGYADRARTMMSDFNASAATRAAALEESLRAVG
jgi:tetratricopeptide (TPR) repeat protein